MRFTTMIAAAAAVAALHAAPPAATAQDLQDEVRLQADGKWVSLSGRITETTDSGFLLDYADGTVRVETGDPSRFGEDTPLAPGERVTVYGEVDDDVYEKRTVVANAVYGKERNSFYTINARNEDDPTQDVPLWVGDPGVDFDVTSLAISGEVTKVGDDVFWIDTGDSELGVDTRHLTYDPLDDTGIQQIRPGDRVQVRGELSDEFFDKRRIAAQTVTTLHDVNPTAVFD